MATTFKELKEGRAAQLEAVKASALQARMTIGRNQEKSLDKCLVLAGKRNLVGKTLLARSIRQKHGEFMVNRLLGLAEKITQSAPQDISGCRTSDELARARLQFVTVLHEVCPLDLGVVRDSAIRLTKGFNDVASLLKRRRFGCSFIGAIEVEIVSMKMMRDAHQGDDEIVAGAGRRKLKVLDSMLGRSRKLRSSSTVALIHCHGVIDLGRCSYDEFRDGLQKMWTKPYQVEVKNLSEQYRGKKKSVTANLKDIAGYITKGANDRIQDGISLHYKLSFDKDMESIEDQMIRDWRKVGSVIRAEALSEGLEHPKSLTMAEIAFHAEAIDLLMGLKRNRMGYVITF
jgi:hypothetical protein